VSTPKSRAINAADDYPNRLTRSNRIGETLSQLLRGIHPMSNTELAISNENCISSHLSPPSAFML
jgi:hypothetical protein